jgi:hypothetical protein
MPRKRRAATASAENGTKSGEGHGRLGLGAAKRLKADGHDSEMGTVENKEVSRFQGFLFHELFLPQKYRILFQTHFTS